MRIENDCAQQYFLLLFPQTVLALEGPLLIPQTVLALEGFLLML